MQKTPTSSPSQTLPESHLEEVNIMKTLEDLRSFCLMVDPDESSLTQADKDKKKELWDKFEFLTLCSRRDSDYFRKSQPRGIKCGAITTVPRFLQLLRESILTHQWPEALKILQPLCHEVRTDLVIWKAGMACLYQDQDTNSRLIEQFAKQAYVLRKVTVVEVLLDYLLYLLTQNNFADAKYLIRELRLNTAYASNLNTERRVMASTLFFAYQGLTSYAEWKLAIMKADQESEELDIMQLMSQGSSNHASKSMADEAVEHLSSIKDVPGVWDVFIDRLVEIHDYYGNTEEARELLRSYCDKNPDNPNAHRYLYDFECNHSEDEAVLLDCLENIVRLDPCNPLCVKLYHIKEKQNNPSAVRILFDFLDFMHCSDHEEVWQLLADKLQDLSRKELKMEVRNCWITRRSWWPQTKFQDLQRHKDPAQLSPLQQNKLRVLEAVSIFDVQEPTKKRSQTESETDTPIKRKAKRPRKR